MYYTGDYAITDDDGYFRILGRADEVLKVAGHRLGSLELESAAVAHPAVAEAATVGIPDPVKGEDIVIFVVVVDGHEPSPTLKADLSEHIRTTVGSIAKPRSIYFVKMLPKTRSGKIMRRVLRSVASDAAIGDITTLEDEASVEEVKRAYEMLKGAV
jgi:acetyl-CoA synthetase